MLFTIINYTSSSTANRVKVLVLPTCLFGEMKVVEEEGQTTTQLLYLECHKTNTDEKTLVSFKIHHRSCICISWQCKQSFEGARKEGIIQMVLLGTADGRENHDLFYSIGKIDAS